MRHLSRIINKESNSDNLSGKESAKIKLLLTENMFVLKINKNKQQNAFLIFTKMFLYLSL